MSQVNVSESEYGEVRDEEQLDWAKLVAHLSGKLDGVDQPLTIKQFRGGHSNLTYLLRFGDKEWVVRRPPFGPLPVGGHDMAREYRVLSRLWEAYQPAPRAMLFSDDESIIGAPFFIMERRTGFVIKNREPLPDWLATRPEWLSKLSAGFIDAVADLHAVDYRKIGLDGLGKPAGFLERQTVNWMKRWEAAKTSEVPLMEKLGKWFVENIPPPQPPALIHNDFYLHNTMIDPADPGHIVGVFDWEMSTIGDPLVDVGLALNYWREKDDPEELLNAPRAINYTLLPGFFSRDDLIQRYAARSHRDLSNIYFYWAWAHWKNATVGQQIYARYVRGQTTDPRFADMGLSGQNGAIAAARVARRLGFRD